VTILATLWFAESKNMAFQPCVSGDIKVLEAVTFVKIAGIRLTALHAIVFSGSEIKERLISE
jgi:hypothetical protein